MELDTMRQELEASQKKVKDTAQRLQQQHEQVHGVLVLSVWVCSLVGGRGCSDKRGAWHVSLTVLHHYNHAGE